jgi:hypothetical protein
MTQQFGTKLFDGATADGPGDAVTVHRGAVAFAAAGTFDGATVTLQLSLDGQEWFDVASLGSKDIKLVDMPPAIIRASISGAGGSTSVTAWIA